MASINYALREISVKIVYYGPGLSGKTTNLQIVHRNIPRQFRSDMVSLSTKFDRTLFFDFLPIDLGKIKEFSTKFQLYSVPGQGYYNATRKIVLRGVDGIVFVADSAPNKLQENLESFQNLKENLPEYSYNREAIPIILQYNKRDLPNAIAIEKIHEQLNKFGLPWSEAIANRGIGVFNSLKMISKIVVDDLNKKYYGAIRAGGEKQQSLLVSQPGHEAYSTPSYQYQQQQSFKKNILQRYYQKNSTSGFTHGYPNAYQQQQFKHQQQSFPRFQQPIDMKSQSSMYPQPQYPSWQKPITYQVVPTRSQSVPRQFLSQQQSPSGFQGLSGLSNPSQPSQRGGFRHSGALSPLYQKPTHPSLQTGIPNQAPTPKQAISPRSGQPFYQYNRPDSAHQQPTGSFSNEVTFEPRAPVSNEVTFEPRAPVSNEVTFEPKAPLSYTQKQDRVYSGRGYYNSGNKNLSSRAPVQFSQQQEAFFEVQSSLPPKKKNNYSQFL